MIKLFPRVFDVALEGNQDNLNYGININEMLLSVDYND